MRLISIIALSLFLTIACYVQVSAQAQAPSFSASDINGKVYKMDDLRGKIVVVNLWFVGCPNCVEEISQLNAIVRQYKNNPNVIFLGFAASSEDQLKPFLAKYPFSYIIFPNAQMIIIGKFGKPDASGNINVPFPMHFVYDKDGKEVLSEQGIKGVAAVKAQLEKLTK